MAPLDISRPEERRIWNNWKKALRSNKESTKPMTEAEINEYYRKLGNQVQKARKLREREEIKAKAEEERLMKLAQEEKKKELKRIREEKKNKSKKVAMGVRKSVRIPLAKKNESRKRCPNGTRRNNKGGCEKKSEPRKRCPNGTRRNNKGDCEKKINIVFRNTNNSFFCISLLYTKYKCQKEEMKKKMKKKKMKKKKMVIHQKKQLLIQSK